MTSEQSPRTHPDADLTPGAAPARSTATPAKSDEMRAADVSNGENPDEETETAGTPSGDERRDQHLTGHRQAAINAENDPPG